MCCMMRPPPEGSASPQAVQRREFLRNTCKKFPQCAPLNPRPPGPRPNARLVTHPTLCTLPNLRKYLPNYLPVSDLAFVNTSGRSLNTFEGTDTLKKQVFGFYSRSANSARSRFSVVRVSHRCAGGGRARVDNIFYTSTRGVDIISYILSDSIKRMYPFGLQFICLCNKKKTLQSSSVFCI